MSDDDAFRVQGAVRDPWRDYLDALVPLRSDLHRYCCGLTGNVWDGEDLVQDALVRVFGLLGRMDANLQDPRAYLIRTATNLWIDRTRRAATERAARTLHAAAPLDDAPDPAGEVETQARVRDAAEDLLGRLPPRERAAVLLKDVFDLTLEEVAAALNISVGAVKSALHRGRGRLAPADTAGDNRPPEALVARFMDALAGRDLEALEAICSADLTVELVGGAEMNGFEPSRTFFEHAHFVLPEMGFGENPHWTLVNFGDEPMVVGYRTLNGIEGVNEVHRLDVVDGTIVRVRCYCWCPDTLALVADHLGVPAVRRPMNPYRSPSLPRDGG